MGKKIGVGYVYIHKIVTVVLLSDKEFIVFSSFVQISTLWGFRIHQNRFLMTQTNHKKVFELLVPQSENNFTFCNLLFHFIPIRAMQIFMRCHLYH